MLLSAVRQQAGARIVQVGDQRHHDGDHERRDQHHVQESPPHTHPHGRASQQRNQCQHHPDRKGNAILESCKALFAQVDGLVKRLNKRRGDRGWCGFCHENGLIPQLVLKMFRCDDGLLQVLPSRRAAEKRARASTYSRGNPNTFVLTGSGSVRARHAVVLMEFASLTRSRLRWSNERWP